MPQKLNKAGKMQDYIPAGNGDPSGEYGTSKGTNKNFTASDKKKSQANVITENKSVVVENKGKETKKDYTIKKESFYDKKNDKNFEHDVIDKLPDGWGKIDGALTAPKGYVWVNNKKSLWDKDYQQAIIKKELLETPNKANVIDNDLSGKKENIDDIEGNVAKAEKVKFSSSELEKNIPNNMRWKEWDIVDDGKALYWITQQPFDKDDLDKFKKELDNTPFEKAYVMTRDMSTYDYKEDKKNGNLQEIVKGKDIKYTPLMEEMDTYWKDFNKKYGKK